MLFCGEDEGAVFGGKSEQGAFEVIEVVLADAFDGGGEGLSGLAEQFAEIGFRDGELVAERGELRGVNARVAPEGVSDALLERGHGGRRRRRGCGP